MREQGQTFPELVINMFYNGAINGTVEDMADYYLTDYRQRLIGKGDAVEFDCGDPD